MYMREKIPTIFLHKVYVDSYLHKNVSVSVSKRSVERILTNIEAEIGIFKL